MAELVDALDSKSSSFGSGSSILPGGTKNLSQERLRCIFHSLKPSAAVVSKKQREPIPYVILPSRYTAILRCEVRRSIFISVHANGYAIRCTNAAYSAEGPWP